MQKTENEGLKVASFANKGLALTFDTILQNNGIDSRLTIVKDHDNQDSFVIEVFLQEDVEPANLLLQRFIKNPQAKEFQDAAWQVAETQNSIAFGSPTINMKRLLDVPFTSFILFTCLAIYLSFFFGAFKFFDDLLSIQPLNQLSDNMQWWRLFGPNFLHFSILHISFNLLWWWILGERLEQSFGTFWLIVLFVVASLFANLSQLYATGPNFGGLSGVVYALFGFVWWIAWLRPCWQISLPKSLIIFILIWLALGFMQILPVNVANQAHLFGLVAGCLLALLLHLWVKLTLEGKSAS